jgi:hypothetical protein
MFWAPTVLSARKLALEKQLYHKQTARPALPNFTTATPSSASGDRSVAPRFSTLGGGSGDSRSTTTSHYHHYSGNSHTDGYSCDYSSEMDVSTKSVASTATTAQSDMDLDSSSAPMIARSHAGTMPGTGINRHPAPNSVVPTGGINISINLHLQEKVTHHIHSNSTGDRTNATNDRSDSVWYAISNWLLGAADSSTTDLSLKRNTHSAADSDDGIQFTTMGIRPPHSHPSDGDDCSSSSGVVDIEDSLLREGRLVSPADYVKGLVLGNVLQYSTTPKSAALAASSRSSDVSSLCSDVCSRSSSVSAGVTGSEYYSRGSVVGRRADQLLLTVLPSQPREPQPSPFKGAAAAVSESYNVESAIGTGNSSSNSGMGSGVYSNSSNTGITVRDGVSSSPDGNKTISRIVSSFARDNSYV